VLLILERCERGEWDLVVSEAIFWEIAQMLDPARKEKVLALVTIASEEIKVTAQVIERAKELAQMNFKPYDALHIACAEVGSASIFLTTDDRLLRKAKRLRKLLRIRVENPVRWLMEVIANESENDDAKSTAGSGN
jgi:predicted nucleic acid-binding protein